MHIPVILVSTNHSYLLFPDNREERTPIGINSFRMVNMIVYTWSQSMDHGFELCCGVERKSFKTTGTTFENAAWL